MWFVKERWAISFLNTQFYLDFHMVDNYSYSTELSGSSGLCT